MKALILLIMSVLMVLFAVGGLRTVEWCLDSGIPVPWQAYAMLASVAVWCIIMANMPEKDFKRMGKLLDKLSGEK
ncbi:hypothetical protein [Parabacteroides provencensis]|uniref:hypothetical protein n=1 Tax=Parabacteroides provencensis TaxID=1944636 RepID=UPI00117F612E|nr:hypothetical protein [Parabacteroides provencensis]